MNTTTSSALNESVWLKRTMRILLFVSAIIGCAAVFSYADTKLYIRTIDQLEQGIKECDSEFGEEKCASALLKLAEMYFRMEMYAKEFLGMSRTVALCEKLIKQYSGTEQAANAHWILGESYFFHGNIDAAKEQFILIDKNYTRSHFRENASWRLAQIYYWEVDYTSALEMVGKLIIGSGKDYQDFFYTAQVMKCELLIREGKIKPARALLGKLHMYCGDKRIDGEVCNLVKQMSTSADWNDKPEEILASWKEHKLERVFTDKIRLGVEKTSRLWGYGWDSSHVIIVGTVTQAEKKIHYHNLKYVPPEKQPIEDIEYLYTIDIKEVHKNSSFDGMESTVRLSYIQHGTRGFDDSGNVTMYVSWSSNGSSGIEGRLSVGQTFVFFLDPYTNGSQTYRLIRADVFDKKYYIKYLIENGKIAELKK